MRGSDDGSMDYGDERRGGSDHAPQAAGRLYAALDLGTNNCRLLIARPDGPGFRVVDAFSRIVRLGEGVSRSGVLSDVAMNRAVAALGVCADKMRRRRVAHMRAIATEACRRADNGEAFIRRVRRETGIRLDVISSREEARLAVAGCAPLFDPDSDYLLVFDIGGGSTEIVWVDLVNTPRARRRDVLLGRGGGGRSERVSWTSLPVGVVTLAERYAFLPDEGDRFAAMSAHVARLISPFAHNGCMPARGRFDRLQLLGTSGTITTLAGVHLGLPRYIRTQVDGVWMPVAALDAVTDRLLSLTPDERAEIPCIGRDRAELVIAGAAILRAITGHWPAQRLRVADRGLREGMLYGLMRAHERAPAGAR